MKALAGGATFGSAFVLVAEDIIGAMAKELEINIQNKALNKKVAHMLIILEDVFGMPVVNVQLLYTSAAGTYKVVQIDKQSGQKETYSFEYFLQQYNYVDPSNLSKNLEGPAYDAWVQAIEDGIS